MKRKLLLICVALLCAVGSWAYTSVVPQVGRSYYLYNMNQNKYFKGTSSDYTTTSDIADATPITIENGTEANRYKLAFVYGGRKYRIYHSKGTKTASNTVGVDFWWEGGPNETYGYQLYSKSGDSYNRFMDNIVEFPHDKNWDNRNWKFYEYEEVLPDLVEHNAGTCATTAEASYVAGWERVTTKEQLLQNPEKYFYAIFSAVNPGVIMTTEYNDNAYRMCYKAAGNPLSSATYDLFEIENYDGEFAIKSNITGKYYGNTSGASWNFIANQETLNEACKVTVTCSNEVFNLQDKYADGNAATDPYVGNYLGAWDNMEFTGERLAGNKSLLRAGYFLIYRKLKKNLDMTGHITNPSFETGNTDGWTVGSSDDTGVRSVTQDNARYAMTNSAGSYLFNTWWQGIPMTQNIGVLPAGQYTLSAVTTTDQGAKTYLTVNSGHNDGATSTGGSSVGVTNTYSFTLAEATEVTIGVVGCGNNDEKAFDPNGYYWYKVDNFRLTYLGGMEDLTPVSGLMNADVNTAQQNAVSLYNSNKTVTNYIAAMDAIAAAEDSKAAYANAAVYLSNVEALLATTNFYTSDAYNSVYGTYKTAYDAGTLDDATAAGLTYKVAGSGGTDRYTNNTANNLLIPGWTIDGNDAITTNSGFYINTWSTEDNSNGFANPFYEYWVADNSVLGAKKIVGTLSGLTENKYYKVTAKVRVRETNSSTKVANSITMQVGSGDKVDVTAGTQISTTTRYVGQFSAIGQADEYGNLVLTFDVASGSNISWLSFRDVNYSDPTPEAKAVLLSTINDANTLYNSGANVGSGVFQIPTAAGTTFSNAIATARGVYDNASSTYEEVLSANSTLQTAITTYEGVTLNAPTGGTRYKLTLAGRGTLTYQTASTEGAYGMPFKAAGDYMAQTFTFTQVSGNTYTMSFEDFDGNTRYICTRAQYGSGGTGTYGIRSFVAGEGGKTALPITIKATTTANVFNMLNTECDNKKLGSNGGDFYTDDAYTSWSIAEASQASVAINLTAGKYATRIFPFTPGTIDGIKFYSCENVEGERAQIDEVVTPEANKPYILKATKDVETELSGWGTAVADSYTQGWLTGVYTATTIAASVEPTAENDGAYRYVLQTQDAVQAFYKVNAEFTATAYRAYLTVPVDKTGAGVKALFLDFGDATGINTIANSQQPMANCPIYNLAGQRLSKAQKGVNIVNGKKVLVK